jgi:hypothetical protein
LILPTPRMKHVENGNKKKHEKELCVKLVIYKDYILFFSSNFNGFYLSVFL